MMALQIRETFTNETRGYRSDWSEWYEPYTDNIGRLFRGMQREYGRCVGRIYVDAPRDGSAFGAVGSSACGWYFEKKVEYEDSGRFGRPRAFYTRGVWVEMRHHGD
jgi:hypothetical protein